MSPLDDSSSPVMADILTDVVMMDHFGGRVGQSYFSALQSTQPGIKFGLNAQIDRIRMH